MSPRQSAGGEFFQASLFAAEYKMQNRRVPLGAKHISNVFPLIYSHSFNLRFHNTAYAEQACGEGDGRSSAQISASSRKGGQICAAPETENGDVQELRFLGCVTAPFSEARDRETWPLGIRMRCPSVLGASIMDWKKEWESTQPGLGRVNVQGKEVGDCGRGRARE